ncbi:MAG: GNAT family N-acetyltransferase [Candidatus Hodarchaeota archaeon]
MIPIEIIEAIKSHIPAIVELWAEMIEYHTQFDQFFKRREDANLNYESFIRDLFNSNEAKIFIAKEEDKILGFILAKIDTYPPIYLYDKYGAIYDLIVKSTYRRRGIGSKLLNTSIEWFYSKGLDRIELNIVSKNEKANDFYIKNGFQEYKRVLYLERKKFKRI